MPKTLFITGGTEGIGYESLLQFAAVPGFEKLILTSRSADKAKAAIAKLARVTGKPESLFGFQLLDLGSPASIQACVAALPSVDALILNASDPSASSRVLGEHGATLAFQVRRFNVVAVALVVVDACRPDHDAGPRGTG